MKGLTSKKAEELLKKYGLNEIKEQKKTPLWRKFFEQFNNFLTLLLIDAAIFSFFLKEPIDGFLIISIVILNAFFGLYQEAKAEESLKALKKMTITKVRVVRDGKQVEIDSKFLVPGDIVYLEEGVKISADGKVIQSINLEINEAALTGESLSVLKKVDEEVFSGTIVSKGRGMMKVTKTGDQTKFGAIAKNLSTITEGLTPLQKKLVNLTKFIGIVGIILSVVVFVISFLEGVGYFPAFLLAVSLAVAVVPEGLPAVMTITLAIGMKKMADKKAILRKLSAIEALGSITLIATDKTGTLTTNKMQVKSVYVNSKIVEISQSQLNQSKSVTNLTDSNRFQSILTRDSFSLLLLNGILCSTASLVYIHDHGSWDVLGDPTEGALLFLAQEKGLDIEEIRKNWKLIDEKPFDSVTKMMSVVMKKKSEIRNPKSEIIFSKGAPESILPLCSKILIGKKEKKLDNFAKTEIENQIKKWASKGLRVLAFSYQANPKQFGNWKLELGVSQVFLGMVAIHDAPRLEVKEAIMKTKSAGIKVVMVTGDNEKTAEAVGVASGLIKEGDEILTGIQLEEYNDEELLKLLPKVRIFARTNPFQKHRIVSLYQKLGEVVAVTGDGVNDAIALKQADVGIAMGKVGTDVARETADMVITDDNFATIVTAIEEGREIINNIKNAIKYLLSCNVSEAFALIIGLILGLPHLFYPIQLLYINLVTDGLPALMLSFSPRHPQLMKITPAKEMELLKKKDQLYIGAIGAVGAVLVIIAYFLFQDLGTTAAFSVLTMIQSFVFIDLWLSHRHIYQNLTYLVKPSFVLAFSIPLVLQFIILSHQLSAALFKVSQVSIIVYLQFIAVSFFVLVGIRIVKRILRL